MNTRKFHRFVGLVLAPFFLITAVTGIALLWRKAEIYGKETKDLLIGFHNWEIAAKYIGVILAIGLIIMALTGLSMIVRFYRRKR